MSLRPIDMTITVQRTPEAGRTQANENARPEIAQQQFADKLHREVKQQDQQVMQTNKSEEGRVDRDGRGNAGGGPGSKRKHKDKQDRQAKAKDSGGSMFDVSV